MPLSIEDKLNLYGVAKGHWIESQKALYAYERGFKNNKRISDWLRQGTFLSAIATAASPAQSWAPLTIISGLLTAILSAAEQGYAPAKQTQTFWEYRGELEEIKKDIVSCAFQLDGVLDLTAGLEPLNQISKRLKDATKIPFEALPSDQELAEVAFVDSVIAGMIKRATSSHIANWGTQLEMVEDVPSGLGYDAPDVVAVTRQASVVES